MRRNDIYSRDDRDGQDAAFDDGAGDATNEEGSNERNTAVAHAICIILTMRIGYIKGEPRGLGRCGEREVWWEGVGSGK